MNDIQKVRLKTGDRSTMKREKFSGTGTKQTFILEKQSLINNPPVRVFVNSTYIAQSDYTVDYTNGSITFNSAPLAGASIEVDYYFAVYSDEEIQVFLDEAGGNTDLAAAKNLLAWAANQARLAMRETLSGGGGIGTVTRDTSVVARELREAAKFLVEQYNTSQTGPDYQSEGLTEVAWTDFSMRDILRQDLIRRG